MHCRVYVLIAFCLQWYFDIFFEDTAKVCICKMWHLMTSKCSSYYKTNSCYWNYFLLSCSNHRFVRKLYSGIVDMRPRNHLYNSNRHDLNNYFHNQQFHNYNSNRLDQISTTKGCSWNKYNYKHFNFNPIRYGCLDNCISSNHFLSWKLHKF